jgi:hypothetical protein
VPLPNIGALYSLVDYRSASVKLIAGMQFRKRSFAILRVDRGPKYFEFPIVKEIILDAVIGARKVIIVFETLRKERKVEPDVLAETHSKAFMIVGSVTIDLLAVRNAWKLMVNTQEQQFGYWQRGRTLRHDLGVLRSNAHCAAGFIVQVRKQCLIVTRIIQNSDTISETMRTCPYPKATS